MANSRELAEQALSLLQDALEESGIREAELNAELNRKRTPKNKLEKQARVLEHRIETLVSERDSWKRENERLEEILDNERARVQQLKTKLDVAESGPDKVGKKEVNYWRARADKFEQEKQEFRNRIAGLKKALQTREESEEPDARLVAEVENLKGIVAQLTSQNEKLLADLADKASELAERDERITELVVSQRAVDEDQQAIRDQISGLQQELQEEKECTVNLSEIANERREQITELSEKLDEAEERYEEARWRLQEASRFERLVARRRKLIDSLIAGLRAKQKSNTALKAGLDGLRKFKANSEEQQQKLLVRIQELSDELQEAEERLADQPGTEEADEMLRRSEQHSSALEERLNAQIEVIENLETELSAARAERRSSEAQASELQQLRETLETRNATIANLETDFDELQKKLAKSGRKDAASPQNSAEMAGLRALVDELAKTVEERDEQIARLSEAVDGWRKKYEFLSTDAPSAYATEFTDV